MTVEIRPTTADDIIQFAARPLPPFRIKAMTGLIDGKVIGIGGIGFPDVGIALAFADLTEEARLHPFSLHRAAVKFLAEARRAGISQLVATSDPQSETAARWLERLGFTLSHVMNDRTVWVWYAVRSS